MPGGTGEADLEGKVAHKRLFLGEGLTGVRVVCAWVLVMSRRK
jgi:hypothetical protein